MSNNKKATDRQVGGDHYAMKIQPIEFIHANEISFCEGNAIKYICKSIVSNHHCVLYCIDKKKHEHQSQL